MAEFIGIIAIRVLSCDLWHLVPEVRLICCTHCPQPAGQAWLRVFSASSHLAPPCPPNLSDGTVHIPCYPDYYFLIVQPTASKVICTLKTSRNEKVDVQILNINITFGGFSSRTLCNISLATISYFFLIVEPRLSDYI
jgi:hypothetical protein